MFALTPVILLFVTFGYTLSFESIVKCCEDGLILNEFMVCEPTLNTTNSLSETIVDVNTTCSKKEVSSSGMQTIRCADVGQNGTLLFRNCSFIHKSHQQPGQCQSLFTPLKFWGVSIVVFASFVYSIPYSVVVILYCVMPDLRRKSFDKGVMFFCFTQVGIALILCTLGLLILCHTEVPKIVYSLVGLTLMFLTISSVLWMSIMCFDVTLTITRFRWTPASSKDDETRKFRIYIIWVYGVSFLSTSIVGILELVPLIPKDWSIKPNFENFYDTNIAVIAYVGAIPFLICVANSALFVYTSWRMFKIQKSTSIAKENRKDNQKKNYIMYLKLYFLMDAPWISSALGAIYPDLWILKLVRMIHPVLLLLTILPRKMVVTTFKCSRSAKS
ncbi:uncharacterized protein LOC117176947 [Belonocnema kinseyi]|uniref:uncharacterized protein LOC117176947 n=1 Tax=Belonocnema kinseyi TaxID=2817044 RepID=UPI00143DCC25|nr:uncharacterized protein LOC117176947 [Belonocnema kinseyi]